MLNILDVDQDGIITVAELAAARSLLPRLDKDGDGKLSLAEAGMQRIPTPDRPVEEPPSPPPGRSGHCFRSPDVRRKP